MGPCCPKMKTEIVYYRYSRIKSSNISRSMSLWRKPRRVMLALLTSSLRVLARRTSSEGQRELLRSSLRGSGSFQRSLRGGGGSLKSSSRRTSRTTSRSRPMSRPPEPTPRPPRSRSRSPQRSFSAHRSVSPFWYPESRPKSDSSDE